MQRIVVLLFLVAFAWSQAAASACAMARAGGEKASASVSKSTSADAGDAHHHHHQPPASPAPEHDDPAPPAPHHAATGCVLMACSVPALPTGAKANAVFAATDQGAPPRDARRYASPDLHTEPPPPRLALQG